MCVRIELQTNWLFLLLILSLSVIHTRCQGEYLFLSRLPKSANAAVVELDIHLGHTIDWDCTCYLGLYWQRIS